MSVCKLYITLQHAITTLKANPRLGSSTEMTYDFYRKLKARVLIKLLRTIVICLIVCVQKLYTIGPAIWKIMDILDFNGSLFVSAEYSDK